MTVTTRGTSESNRQVRMYFSPATIKVSDPAPISQRGSLNEADRNSSILSTTRLVATAICRLEALVRMTNEKTEAAATSPHTRMPIATSTSIRVNPRFVFKVKTRKKGRGVKNTKTGSQQKSSRHDQMFDVPSNQVVAIQHSDDACETQKCAERQFVFASLVGEADQEQADNRA